MSGIYYNYAKLVSKEELDQERKQIIDQLIKEAVNDDNLIDDEDLDFI
ncbi:hypothetical protein [Winogradskyella luteola]|uniref:Uncharacterized protein n=1 Tax=Winogradskyella luteola TaxID=2828330 RepID=A0A9X1F633_9FLAO|nr:hypothetical protein [Winogradskyella luteola]MBV7268065.1 hypothetical protein [Winogradskyella luteola]